MTVIKTALLAVHDKAGLADFAKALHDRGVELLSTGGTAAVLGEAGLPVRSISAYTEQEEMLGGRVKTLHPRIFGGILARRDDPQQIAELEKHDIAPIDLVAVNLYPFAATVAVPDHCLQDALEQIDIGGVSLLRAAAKNAPHVVVVADPADYDEIIEALDRDELPLSRRLAWARRAVAHTAVYEAAICNYLNGISLDEVRLDEHPPREPFPEALTLPFRRLQALRYGENPHQAAAFFGDAGDATGLATAEQLHGKELSYNNLLDLDAAWQLVAQLSVPGAAVIKHNNPCGAACAESLAEAYRDARATDPLSAFGSIVALNQPVDGETAREIATTFIEAVIAPDFAAEALEALRTKKSLRLMRMPSNGVASRPVREVRAVAGGLLVQDRDPGGGGEGEEWRCVTQRAPDDAEDLGLRFAWRVVPHVRSNAIVVAKGQQLIGVGAGQMSRVDSCRIAVWKARDAGHDLSGSVAASDAFFPFPDGVETLAEAGVTAVVQPGGSVRDEDVIEAANRLAVTMVMTGARHFRH